MSTSRPVSAQDIVVFSGTPNSGGTPISSWSSPTQLTVFTSAGFAFAGNLIVNGSSICFPFTAHFSGAQTEGTFYGCYNTSNGSFTDISGVTVIPSGSLPFSVAMAQSDFQVVAWPGGTDTTIIPAQAIDNNGITHVIYTVGTDGSGVMNLYEAYYNNGFWTTGNPIGGHASDDTLQPTLVPTSTGVQVFWGQSTNYPTVFDNAYTATSTTLGAWSPPTEILAAGNYSLSMFSTVTNDNTPNSPTPFSAVYSEQNQPGGRGIMKIIRLSDTDLYCSASAVGGKCYVFTVIALHRKARQRQL